MTPAEDHGTSGRPWHQWKAIKSVKSRNTSSQPSRHQKAMAPAKTVTPADLWIEPNWLEAYGGSTLFCIGHHYIGQHREMTPIEGGQSCSGGLHNRGNQGICQAGAVATAVLPAK